MTTITDPTRTAPPTPLVSSQDREKWHEFRRQGCTATDIGKLMRGGAARREVITKKLTEQGLDQEIVGNKYIDRGNEREPVIAAWIEENFGIRPNDVLYAGVDPRHLATPDGLSDDVEEDGLTSEIKTSNKDLDPGCGNGNVLVMEKVNEAWRSTSRFWNGTDYYAQMQWQMLVMHGERVLFVWEQHDNQWYQPGGPKPVHEQPQWCWIMRDDAYIEKMVEVANEALATIDKFRADGLAPLGEIDGELAQHVHNLLQHRDDEAIAKKQKEVEWAWIKAHVKGRPAFEAKNDEASITWDPEHVGAPGPVTDVNYDGMAKKAPALVEKYEALKKRYTTTTMKDPKPKEVLNVSAIKTSKTEK